MHIILPNGQPVPVLGGPQAAPPEVNAAFGYLQFAHGVALGPLTHEGQMPAPRELTAMEVATQRSAHQVLRKYFESFDPRYLAADGFKFEVPGAQSPEGPTGAGQVQSPVYPQSPS